MTTSLAPLRDEHRELVPHIEQLRATADRVGAMPRARLVSDIQSSLDFLTRHLRPHALVEDDVLYPEVARVMGSAVAVETMRRDHAAIARLTDDLAQELAAIRASREITRATQNELRRTLYGLHALISVHFSKEEEVYIPLIEQRLDDREAASLLDAMRARHHEHDDDGFHGVAHDVLEALYAGIVIDDPGAPAVTRPEPESPASDADAPAPPG